MAGLDRGPGDLQAQALHGLRGGRAGLRREGAGEVPRAHRGAVGQALDGQRLGEVRPHPLHQPGEAARPPAQLHEGRELRLPAGPAPVDDELLRRPAGGLRAEVVLDEGQGQVDAGGDAGRGPDVAVPDEDALGVELHLRVAAAEIVRAVPMRGGAAAVEQTGLGEEVGARADAGDPSDFRAPQPSDDLLRGRDRADDLAAGDDDRVEGVCPERPGRKPEPGRALHLAPAGRQQRQVVAAGAEPLRDLERRRGPGRVQQLEPGEDHDGDRSAHGRFRPIYVISDRTRRR